MENFKQIYNNQMDYSSSHTTMMNYQLLKERRDKLKLDLTNIPEKKLKFQSILTSPDLKMLKLASPELEKLILSQPSLFTPTPTQYFFPNKPATEEQELYARGFFDALTNIKQKYQNPFALNTANSNYVSFINTRTNSNKVPSDFPTIYFPSAFTNTLYSNESHINQNQNIESKNMELSKINGQNENVFKYPNNSDILSCIFFNNYNLPGQRNAQQINNASTVDRLIPPIPYYNWSQDQNCKTINQPAPQSASLESNAQSSACECHPLDSEIPSSEGILRIHNGIESEPYKLKIAGSFDDKQNSINDEFVGMNARNTCRGSPYVNDAHGTNFTSHISDVESFNRNQQSASPYVASVHGSDLRKFVSDSMDLDESKIATRSRRSKCQKRGSDLYARSSLDCSANVLGARSSNVSTCSSRRSVISTLDYDENDLDIQDDNNGEDGSELDAFNATALSPINLEAQEKIKIERKRLRNRIAATKCRQRKLEKICELEKCVAELKQINDGTQTRLQEVKARVTLLKASLKKHVEAGCLIPSEYVD